MSFCAAQRSVQRAILGCVSETGQALRTFLHTGPIENDGALSFDDQPFELHRAAFYSPVHKRDPEKGQGATLRPESNLRPNLRKFPRTVSYAVQTHAKGIVLSMLSFLSRQAKKNPLPALPK
jgi:hypothetical protein